MSAYRQSLANQTPQSKSVVDFVDISFENASPLWYESDAAKTLQLHLIYDNERSSPNRAAGHFHLRLVGKPNADIRVELNNLDNVWNSVASSVVHEFNCNWIAGINERPLAKHWKQYGEQLTLVFEMYFADNR